jgi:cytochrome bd ubiquinol oxidase subunit II
MIGFRFAAAWWGLPLQVGAALAAAGAVLALWRRRYGLARLLAVAEAVGILWGWALAQYPFLVAPDLTISSAAAPPEVLRVLVGVVPLGALVLFPSLAYLYRVFKARRRAQ